MAFHLSFRWRRGQFNDKSWRLAVAIARHGFGKIIQDRAQFIPGRGRPKISQNPNRVALLENAGNGRQISLQHRREPRDVCFMTFLGDGNHRPYTINDDNLGLAPGPIGNSRGSVIIGKVTVRRGRGKFEQGIETEVSNLVLFEGEFSSDPGGHGRAARSDRTADDHLTRWCGRGRAVVNELLQRFGIFFADIWRRISKPKQIRN